MIQLNFIGDTPEEEIKELRELIVPQSVFDDVAKLQEQVADMMPKALSENEDLNNLDIGRYYIPTVAISATILNKPIDRNSNACIIVEQGAADDEFIMWFFVNTTAASVNNKVYYRYKHATGWSDWFTGYFRPDDSGWLQLPLAEGIVEHNSPNFPCRYRKIGNVVYIEGCVKGFSEVEKIVASIPNGYRPSKPFYMQNATNGGNTDTFNVQTNGNIQRVSTTMPVSSLSDSNYHFINMSYVCD